MFDLGAAALIFSGALAVTPKGLPHHEVFVKAGVVSMGLTLAIAVFAGVVRAAGGAVAGFARATLGRLSKPVGESINCDEDYWISRWVGMRCLRCATLLDCGAAVAGDVGDDCRGVRADGAFVCADSRARGSEFFADDVADGGEYWRVVGAASDYWMDFTQIAVTATA